MTSRELLEWMCAYIGCVFVYLERSDALDERGTQLLNEAEDIIEEFTRRGWQ